jgi:hypothetical protein
MVNLLPSLFLAFFLVTQTWFLENEKEYFSLFVSVFFKVCMYVHFFSPVLLAAEVTYLSNKKLHVSSVSKKNR